LATRAYILIETAVVEADDLPSIGDLISDGMPSIPGIVKTVTCLSVRN
jgi:hypothetical protein